jgi:hypothetical protein
MVQFKNMLGLHEEKLMLLGCIISYTNSVSIHVTLESLILRFREAVVVVSLCKKGKILNSEERKARKPHFADEG